MYKLTGEQVPIVGAGGISLGKDALEKIAAGALAVQIYSAMAFEGPGVATRVRHEIEIFLEAKDLEAFKKLLESTMELVVRKCSKCSWQFFSDLIRISGEGTPNSIDFLIWVIKTIDRTDCKL